jgi:hypothetical protein
MVPRYRIQARGIMGANPTFAAGRAITLVGIIEDDTKPSTWRKTFLAANLRSAARNR